MKNAGTASQAARHTAPTASAGDSHNPRPSFI